MKPTNIVRWIAFALLLMVIPASSSAGVLVSVTIVPPVLPVYVQPACPGDGYMWTPGYWAYGPDGYYWVPGTWVVAPEPGLLWTPGYWRWNEGFYVWHGGYWGPHIGFYGGVNYGFGYFGSGYEGGYWRGRTFFYNRSVNNVTITNVHIYNKTVINNRVVNRVSYNGGNGGINARPGRFEETAAHERHFEPTGMQIQHERSAGSNRDFLASVNHGRPLVAATARPGEFSGRGVVPARSAGGPYRPENRGGANRGAENRPLENRGGGASRSLENRPSQNRPSENRGMSRPSNSERGMPRTDSHAMANNGGARRRNPASEVRERGSIAPRPNPPRQGNASPRASAPREDRGSHPANGQEKPRH
jgi:WXXGXW repeat (2 copies)